jgi:hypothetical protein
MIPVVKFFVELNFEFLMGMINLEKKGGGGGGVGGGKEIYFYPTTLL